MWQLAIEIGLKNRSLSGSGFSNQFKSQTQFTSEYVDPNIDQIFNIYSARKDLMMHLVSD
jgi:hypothetical protein